MIYTIYDPATGQIIRSIFGRVEDAENNCPSGCLFIPTENYPTETQYVANIALVDMPTKPSPSHKFDYVTKQWADPRTLVELRAAKWQEIKQARSDAEYAGFMWDGSVFDSDVISQNRISGAVQLATLVGNTFTIDWTLKDNSVRTLSAADLTAVAMTLGQHVQAQFVKAQGLRAQVDIATVAELATIGWAP